MWLKSFALIALLSGLSRPMLSQQQLTSEQAFDLASRSHKHVLLIFAGSDWCAPCIQFEKDILSKETFKAFAEANLVVHTADFPQRKSLSKMMIADNEGLADRYNPKGVFPNIVLLTSDGKTLGTVPYHTQSAAEFIVDLKKILPDE